MEFDGCTDMLWHPVKFEGCSQTSTWTTFTQCSGVQQRIRRSWSRLWDHIAIIRLHRVQILWASIKWSQSFALLKCAIYAATRPQFDDRPSFNTVSFRNESDDRNFDFRGVICTDMCISCRNLVRFRSVTSEFKISSCTAGVENFTGITIYFFWGGGC